VSEVYTIVCDNVAVTQPQDILMALASTTKKLQLLGVEIAANGQTTVGNYPIRVRYLPPTVTVGSGGTPVTPGLLNPAGAAATFSARANDTTNAVTGGTATIWLASQINPINGYYNAPPVPQGDEPLIELNGAVVLTLEAVTGTLGLSATMWLREI
jgi:hypothetical protein